MSRKIIVASVQNERAMSSLCAGCKTDRKERKGVQGVGEGRLLSPGGYYAFRYLRSLHRNRHDYQHMLMRFPISTELFNVFYYLCKTYQSIFKTMWVTHFKCS